MIYNDIRNFPFGLKELAFKRKLQYDRKTERTMSENHYSLQNAFGWEDTKEGEKFWSDIDDRKFSCFYNKYPKNVDNFSII